MAGWLLQSSAVRKSDDRGFKYQPFGGIYCLHLQGVFVISGTL